MIYLLIQVSAIIGIIQLDKQFRIASGFATQLIMMMVAPSRAIVTILCQLKMAQGQTTDLVAQI